jgi:uncharacterized oligopeptide transporter (OPT) family protein
VKGKEEAGILRFEAVPSLSLILMGSMDWLTTIIGIGFFGAVESNPFMAGLIGTSVITFSAVKLATTVFVAFLFYKADKTLFAFPDKNSRSFMFTRVALRAAYIMATTLLLAAVVNNLLVVAKAF